MRAHLIATAVALLPIAACTAGEAGAPRPLTIAAAASVRPWIEALRAADHGPELAEVRFVYGSSGQLAAQLAQGAPHDVLLSADRRYAEQAAAGHPERQTFHYADGRLLLVLRAGLDVDASRGLACLTDDKVRRIAIAHRTLAPYGRAAIETLTRAELLSDVASKLAFGENVGQAMHFVASGAADAALVSAWLVPPAERQPQRMWLVPNDLHAPIEHHGVLATPSPAAHAFVARLRGEVGRAALRRITVDGGH